MAADVDLMRRTEALQWQLLDEVWVRIPAAGARRAEEKDGCADGLCEVASWVGLWIWSQRDGAFDWGRAAEGLDFALAMARVRAEALPAERWARERVRGLERGLELAKRVFPGAEGTPESASEAAERQFFAEAERVLGRGDAAGDGEDVRHD